MRERESLVCLSGGVSSEMLFPGGSGVASLSPGWSPGVLAEGASAGWVCRQLHLYTLWQEEGERRAGKSSHSTSGKLPWWRNP